jgi:hypothetical protein
MSANKKSDGAALPDEVESFISSPKRADTVTLTMEEWKAWRKAAGLHIDPETAEVFWEYTQVTDPYGVCPDIPQECDCVGRTYFARSPGTDVWIWFGDLPDATHKALWEKHQSKLAFPAGLEVNFFIQRYVEQNFGPISNLSLDELAQAMAAAGYQAYLAQTTAHEEVRDEIKGQAEP